MTDQDTSASTPSANPESTAAPHQHYSLEHLFRNNEAWVARKLSVNGVPGMFNAPVAIETYAKVFEEEGALDKLEAFAAINGATHYRLPVNAETITLEKTPWVAPQEIKVEGPDERAIVYRGGETIEWKVVNG